MPEEQKTQEFPPLEMKCGNCDGVPFRSIKSDKWCPHCDGTGNVPSPVIPAFTSNLGHPR